jgi:hypothetical protein
MKKVKPVIAFVWLVVLCGSAVWVEYNLVVRFGIMLSVFAGVCGLFCLVRCFEPPKVTRTKMVFIFAHAASKRAMLDMSSRCLVIVADA